MYSPCHGVLIWVCSETSFTDPTFSIAMKMTYEEINRQRRMLSNDLEIAKQHHLNYSFDKTPEQA